MRSQKVHQIQTDFVGRESRLTARTGDRVVALIVVAALAIGIDLITWLIFSRFNPGRTVTRILAVLPFPGNVALIVMVFRAITRLDEFKKRIHLEAVLFAFLTTLLAVLAFCSLRVARLVGQLHGAHVLWLMIITYAGGYVLALRRYK